MKEILGRLPADVDWRIWHVASHPATKASLVEIQRDWTVLDVLQALDVINARAEIEEALTPEPPTAPPQVRRRR